MKSNFIDKASLDPSADGGLGEEEEEEEVLHPERRSRVSGSNDPGEPPLASTSYRRCQHPSCNFQEHADLEQNRFFFFLKLGPGRALRRG